ncbi:MAG: hypothetical protein EOO93_23730, partial [Pedobacter sp.]
MENQENVAKKPSQSIDFYKIFKVFLSRWYWILGCLIISLILAKVHLFYTPPMYQTGASLKLEESNPSIGTGAQMSSQVYNYTDKIQAESFTIRSNAVILNAVKTLNYKISYYLKGRVRTTELYPNVPFVIEIIKQDSVNFDRSLYEVTAKDNKHFNLGIAEGENSQIYAYGQPINMGNMTFRIMDKIPAKSTYQFKFNSREEFIG